MSDFYFKVGGSMSERSSVGPIDLPDEAAARNEAGAILADFARNIASDLATCPEWVVEVCNGTGAPIFKIRVIAETL